MKKYSIYKIISPSGKVYIGQTCNLEKRIKSYNHCQNNQLRIYKSIKKYGYDNHIFEILNVDLTKEEADFYEIKYIKYFKELNISLNISDGGNLLGRLRSKEVLQFDLNGNYIRHWNSIADISRECGFISKTISHAAKSKCYYSNGFLWIFKTDFDDGEMPYWKYQSVTTKRKKVYQFDTLDKLIYIWNSIEECARNFNVAPQTIRANINRISNLTQGYKFSHNKNPPKIKYDSIKWRKIKMFDRNEIFIRTFDTAKQAAAELDISYKCINACLNNSKKIYKNFKFRYDKESYKD